MTWICSDLACLTPSPQARSIAYRDLNIQSVHHSALDPVPLHDPGDLVGALVVHQGTDEVQRGVYASAVATSCDDAKAAEPHGSTASDGLAARHGPLEGHAALAA